MFSSFRGLRSRALGLLVAVALPAVTACGTSLESVKTTASLGTQLRQYEPVFELGPVYCRYSNVRPEPDPICAKLQDDLPKWRKVNHALVGYAIALRAMADDSSDKSEADNVATNLAAVGKLEPFSNALNANVTAGVSSGVGTLATAVKGYYRRGKLAGSIRDSNAALQNIVVGISQNVELIDQAEGNLQAVIEDTIGVVRTGESSPAKIAQVTSLAGVSTQIADHRRAMANYAQAVKAFANAHAAIAAKVDSLGSSATDAEVRKQIIADLTRLVESAKLVVTEPAP